MLAKVSLIIVGILVLVMGVMAVIPALSIGAEPMWHAIVKMVVGVAAVIIGIVAKK
ncbi:MAG: hypothetical protein U9O59_04905 [Actinomycetota bacterium]|nr:hypothetical protein [Actinomycetota bacterium]